MTPEEQVQKQIEAIKDTVDHFREMRKKRSMDFTVFTFQEFAKENKIPDTLAAQMIEMIKDPKKEFNVKFKAN